MVKRIALFFILAIAFLCLVSCSSLLEEYFIYNGILSPVTTSAQTTHAPVVITTPDPADTELQAPEIPPVTTVKTNGVLIMLDAGHGENDPGAAGKLDGVSYPEKEFNLDVCLRLKDELALRGYEVLCIRETDTSLLHGWDTQGEAVARRELGASRGVDLYISLHCNSFAGSGRAWGPIIFYNGTSQYKAEKMAKCLQKSLVSGFSDFPTTRACRLVDDGDYIVLKDKKMPSFLIEMGFLTDASDLSLFLSEDWRSAMAKAIADGVDELLEDDFIG